MKKATITLLLLSLFLFPFTTHASEGIPLQMDVFLGTPVYGPEDLPENGNEYGRAFDDIGPFNALTAAFSVGILF